MPSFNTPSRARFCLASTLAITFLVPGPLQAQECPGKLPAIVLADTSLVARKVAFSPDGNFLAYTAASGGNVSQLFVASVSTSGISWTHTPLTLGVTSSWNDEVDFVWHPNSQTIFYTNQASPGVSVNRTAIRRRTFNGSFWGGEEVVFVPQAGITMVQTRLALADAASVFFTYANGPAPTAQSFICRFVIPQILPGSLFGFQSNTAPNQRQQVFTGITSPTTVLLCSDRNSITGQTQYFTMQPGGFSGFSAPTNVGSVVNQTLDDIRYATLAPDAGPGVAALSVNNQLVLHGAGFNQMPLTSPSSPISSIRAPRVNGGLITCMVEEDGEFHPAIIPVRGGGVVRLASSRFWFFPSTPFVAPVASPTGNRVVYVDRGAIYSVRSDRELVVFDRSTTTGTFQVTFPCSPNESGIAFVDLSFMPPTAAPGFCGFAQLDLVTAIPFLNAIGGDVTSFPVPLSSAFLGATLCFQAGRIGPTQSEITRLVRSHVF